MKGITQRLHTVISEPFGNSAPSGRFFTLYLTERVSLQIAQRSPSLSGTGMREMLDMVGFLSDYHSASAGISPYRMGYPILHSLKLGRFRESGVLMTEILIWVMLCVRRRHEKLYCFA